MQIVWLDIGQMEMAGKGGLHGHKWEVKRSGLAQLTANPANVAVRRWFVAFFLTMCDLRTEGIKL